MRQIQPTIVVIGFMGAGKTSVGRLVARALGREFIDTDLMIERATRMTISELFQREGELSFRRREMAAIDRAISVPGRVIAVGGGAVLSAENRTALKQAGPAHLPAGHPQDPGRPAHRGHRPALLKDAPPTGPAASATCWSPRPHLRRPPAAVAIDTDRHNVRAGRRRRHGLVPPPRRRLTAGR
jgi:shikimate kinase